MEKISIIVPVYKVSTEKLKNCINSLISQTYKNLEIILVDDGSPDMCPKICDNFSKNDKRIKVIHQNNKGLSGARNSGVKFSNGTWYTFVDGDDFLIKNGIELLVNEIEKDVDVICTRTEELLKSKGFNSYPYENQKVYSTKEELNYVKQMQLSFEGNNSSSCGKLYSRKFTEKYNLFHDETLKQGAEDLEFTFRVFQKAKKIKIITDFCVYKYVNNVNSITRSFNLDNEYLKIKCFEKIRKSINNDDIEMLDLFYNRFLYSILNSAISGFFSPTNKQSYTIQKKEFITYLNHSFVKETLNRLNNKPMDKIRKFTLFLIKHNSFLLVKGISYIRFYQKQYLSK